MLQRLLEIISYDRFPPRLLFKYVKSTYPASYWLGCIYIPNITCSIVVTWNRCENKETSTCKTTLKHPWYSAHTFTSRFLDRKISLLLGSISLHDNALFGYVVSCVARFRNKFWEELNDIYLPSKAFMHRVRLGGAMSPSNKIVMMLGMWDASSTNSAGRWIFQQ
jgi:hypothetical protein